MKMFLKELMMNYLDSLLEKLLLGTALMYKVLNMTIPCVVLELSQGPMV